MTKLLSRFGFLWGLTTVISSSIGFPLGYIVGDYLFPDRYFSNQHLEIAFIFTILTVLGFVIGFGQWLILRTRKKNSLLWIPATALGIPFGIFIGFWINEFLPISLRFLASTEFMFGIAGIFLGIFQLIAIEKLTRMALLWITVSSLSLVFSFTFMLFISNLISSNVAFEILNYAVLGLSFGSIIGLFTGIIAKRSLISVHRKAAS